MLRVARTVIPGVPHHVTQGGNNRQDVFFVDDDRRAYLSFLKRHSQDFGLRILGYCLMTNHVHLIVVPASEMALAKAVGRAHYGHTQVINRLHGRSGHLWQNRFYSCPMDEIHTLRALCYVERNPVRARLVRAAWRYPWSSAAAHCGGSDPSDLLDLSDWSSRGAGSGWKKELQSREDAALVGRMRRCLRTGRPLGSDRFISKLEVALGRRLRPLAHGRPRKEPAQKSSKARRKRSRKR